MMPNLSIKNVPASVLTELRKRAARHHRSIQGELMALLSAVVASPPEAEPSEATRAPQGRRAGTRRIEEIAAEHRSRWKRPFKQGPTALDVLRADRDAR
jgi:plasmid stability protein